MAQKPLTDWATSDIADIGNGDPNKQLISSELASDGWPAIKPLVQDMNQILHLLSHFGRANNEFKRKSTGYEAEAGELIEMDNSAAVATLLLPADPIEGQWVIVSGKELYSVFAVTVDGNSRNIMIAADTSCVLDVDSKVFMFYWNSTDSMWIILDQGKRGRIV